MGMSYELYWFGDTWLVKAYREADRLRQERLNEMAWLQGLYNSAALNSTVGNAFLQRGSQPNRYPIKPLSMSDKDEEQKEADETAFAKLYMNNMVRAGKNWGRGKR